jgi:NAD-dependent SIR2 family protein deacetylase
LASQAGAQVIIINREATPFDTIAERRLSSDIGNLLARLHAKTAHRKPAF